MTNQKLKNIGDRTAGDFCYRIIQYILTEPIIASIISKK
jgi:hypothetical protein